MGKATTTTDREPEPTETEWSAEKEIAELYQRISFVETKLKVAAGTIPCEYVPSVDDQRAPVPVKCSGCTFMDAPWHDLFLTLETSGEPWIYLFRNLEMKDGPEGFSDVAAFIRAHNWGHPEGMEHVAQLLVITEDKGPSW